MKKTVVIILLMLSATLSAQRAMNRPYADDKLIHFGFSIGMNFMGYGVKDSGTPVSGVLNAEAFQNQLLHARTSYMIPGFSVGFITDLRLSRHLNLRFIPQMEFGERVISYKFDQNSTMLNDEGEPKKFTANVLCLPISVPLQLKWSAEREGNYRPYVVAGGGISYDFGQDKERQILQRPLDYFVQVGFGCDFYFSWFKFCPEIKYQLGFNNVLTPSEERLEGINVGTDGFYSDAISRLRNHMISIVFNFE